MCILVITYICIVSMVCSYLCKVGSKTNIQYGRERDGRYRAGSIVTRHLLLHNLTYREPVYLHWQILVVGFFFFFFFFFPLLLTVACNTLYYMQKPSVPFTDVLSLPTAIIHVVDGLLLERTCTYCNVS